MPSIGISSLYFLILLQLVTLTISLLVVSCSWECVKSCLDVVRENLSEEQIMFSLMFILPEIYDYALEVLILPSIFNYQNGYKNSSVYITNLGCS